MRLVPGFVGAGHIFLIDHHLIAKEGVPFVAIHCCTMELDCRKPERYLCKNLNMITANS